MIRMFHCIFFFQLISSSLTITTTSSLLPFIIGTNSLVLLGDIYFEASKVQEGLKIEKSSQKIFLIIVIMYIGTAEQAHMDIHLARFIQQWCINLDLGTQNLYRASRYVYIIFLPLFIIFSTIIYECHTLSIEVITKINYNYCHLHIH